MGINSLASYKEDPTRVSPRSRLTGGGHYIDAGWHVGTAFSRWTPFYQMSIPSWIYSLEYVGHQKYRTWYQWQLTYVQGLRHVRNSDGFLALPWVTREGNRGWMKRLEVTINCWTNYGNELRVSKWRVNSILHSSFLLKQPSSKQS